MGIGDFGNETVSFSINDNSNGNSGAADLRSDSEVGYAVKVREDSPSPSSEYLARSGEIGVGRGVGEGSRTWTGGIAVLAGEVAMGTERTGAGAGAEILTWSEGMHRTEGGKRFRRLPKRVKDGGCSYSSVGGGKGVDSIGRGGINVGVCDRCGKNFGSIGSDNCGCSRSGYGIDNSSSGSGGEGQGSFASGFTNKDDKEFPTTGTERGCSKVSLKESGNMRWVHGGDGAVDRGVYMSEGSSGGSARTNTKRLATALAPVQAPALTVQPLVEDDDEPQLVSLENQTVSVLTGLWQRQAGEEAESECFVADRLLEPTQLVTRDCLHGERTAGSGSGGAGNVEGNGEGSIAGEGKVVGEENFYTGKTLEPRPPPGWGYVGHHHAVNSSCSCSSSTLEMNEGSE
ncbi:unnamed protein product, partial [Choristocarpus tenellus]